MASRPAVRSVLSVFSAAAALVSVWFGSPGPASAAEPVSGPSRAAAAEALDAASTVPDEYPPPSARTNLLLAGAATTAAWYGLALGASYAWPDTVGAKELRIPVAGPWLALSHSGCGNVSDCSTALVVVRAIATTLDAIGQASGLAFVAEGLFLPTRERRRRASDYKRTGFQVRPSFDAGKNTVGVGVLGVF